MKKLLQNVGLVLFGLAISLLCFEIYPRVAPNSLVPTRLRQLGDTMERNRHSDSFFVPDSELLFKIPPNTDFVVKHPDYTTRLKTNLNLKDIGFRGGTLGGEPWGVAVGDSFTFGQGVDQEDTWVAQVAKALGHDVINFGIPAQGPAQYTRVLKKYALPMHPKVAFYGFYFNDLDSVARFRRMKRQFIPVSRYLRYYSYVFNLIRESKPATQVQPVLAQADNAEMSLDPEGLRRSLERQNRVFEERWTLVAHEIDDGIKASKAAGVTFVLLYLPSRWEIYWDSLKEKNHLPDSLKIDRLRQTVVSYCAKQDVLCLDLTPTVKQAASQGKQVYFPIDGHWNKEGNRIVAGAIRDFLSTKAVLKG